MQLKGPIHSQEQSSFFSKLPPEVRKMIYTDDKLVLATFQKTCKRGCAETDKLIDATSVKTDISAWSVIRRQCCGNVPLPELEKPKSAKWVCQKAHEMHVRNSLLSPGKVVAVFEELDKIREICMQERSRERSREMYQMNLEKRLDVVNELNSLMKM